MEGGDCTLPAGRRALRELCVRVPGRCGRVTVCHGSAGFPAVPDMRGRSGSADGLRSVRDFPEAAVSPSELWYYFNPQP